MRFAILLLMFEETGKLLNLVRECEKAAKADYLAVRVEGFHDNCLNGRRALAQILEEMRTVEKASQTLGKGAAEMTGEPAFTKVDFCELKDRMQYLNIDRKARDRSVIPTPELMDRLASIMERNALSAGDYIHELGRALGLWIELGLRPRTQQGRPHALRYR